MSKIEQMAFHEQRLQDYKTRIRMDEKRLQTLANDAIRRDEQLKRKDATIERLTAELQKSRTCNTTLRKALGRLKNMTNEPGEIRVMSRLDECTKPWKPEVGSRIDNLGNWQDEAKPIDEVRKALEV